MIRLDWNVRNENVDVFEMADDGKRTKLKFGRESASVTKRLSKKYFFIKCRIRPTWIIIFFTENIELDLIEIESRLH